MSKILKRGMTAIFLFLFLTGMAVTVLAADAIMIREFTVSSFDEDKVKAEFLVEFPTETMYRYQLSAVLIDENGSVTGSRELSTGTAYTGRKAESNVSLRDLAEYEGYHMQLEVWCKENDVETWDSQVSAESFSASGENTLQPLQGVDLRADITDGTLIIDWQNYKVSCDHYLVSVITGKETDGTPYYHQEIKNRTDVTVELPQDCEQITVEMRYFRYDGAVSEAYSRTLDLKTAVCSINTAENTASAQAEIAYETKKALSAEVSVNEQVQAIQLDGSGVFSVNIEEFQNKITLSCKADDMSVIEYSWNVFSDRIPPNLRFYERIDGITVEEETFLLVGEAEGGSSVTVNGESIELSDQGTFQKEMKLQSGRNAVTVEAVDAVGNKAAINAVIYQGASGTFDDQGESQENEFWMKQWLPVMAAFFFGICGVLIVFITVLVMDKRIEKHGKGPRGIETVTLLRNLMIFGVFAAVLLTIWFTMNTLEMQRLAESAQFLESAEKSVSGAYEILQKTDQYKKLRILSIASAVIFAVWSIVLEVLRRIIRKSKQNPT